MQNDHPVPAKAGDPTEDKGSAPDGNGPDRSLLIVDDDNTFFNAFEPQHGDARLHRGRRAFGRGRSRGHRRKRPRLRGHRHASCRWQRARCDTRAEGETPRCEGIILTGYGNIVTAVTGRKARSLRLSGQAGGCRRNFQCTHGYPPRQGRAPENPMSADRVRWEHIQRIYELCGRNVSETARRLNMHRRTLQRILAKKAPR